MLTVDQLQAIYPRCADPLKYTPIINDAWAEFGMTNRVAQAGWMGIIGGETGGELHVKRENMNYSPSRGNAVFGPRGRKCQHLAPLSEGNHVGLRDGGRQYAACVYENMYGNGPRETEDGWNYRGGGIIGITFKDLYLILSRDLKVDFVANPDALGEPSNSVRAAVWFCTKLKPKLHNLLKVDDENTFLQAALMVGNPADAAATQRRLQFRRDALSVL